MFKFIRLAAILFAAVFIMSVATGTGTADARPHKAKIVKRKGTRVVKTYVSKSGRSKVYIFNQKVYVRGKGWTKRVATPRKLRVVTRWRHGNFKYRRYNMRVSGGIGDGHRIKRKAIVSRETRLRQALVRYAKASLSTRTGFYRYSQGGYFSFDPTSYGRSDCSQWTASIYKHATGRFIGGNTWAQAARGHRTSNPKPGDLMFSSSLGHVEMYIGYGRTIGHGSAPIDYGRTSYWPSHFYVTFF